MAGIEVGLIGSALLNGNGLTLTEEEETTEGTERTEGTELFWVSGNNLPPRSLAETDLLEMRCGMGLIYETESFQIKGAAMRVYKALGCGFLESVYQECLELEFTRLGIPFVPQKKLEMRYDGLALRQAFKADFVCFEKIIVEVKAVRTLAPEHQAQVINYLKATGMQLGFLFNFGSHPLLEQLRIPNVDRNRR